MTPARSLLTRYMAVVIDSQGFTHWGRSEYSQVFSEDERSLLQSVEDDAQDLDLRLTARTHP